MPCRHPRWPAPGLVIASLCVAGAFIAFWAGVIALTLEAARLVLQGYW